MLFEAFDKEEDCEENCLSAAAEADFPEEEKGELLPKSGLLSASRKGELVLSILLILFGQQLSLTRSRVINSAKFNF